MTLRSQLAIHSRLCFISGDRLIILSGCRTLSLSLSYAWQDEPDTAILTSQVDALFTQGLYH